MKVIKRNVTKNEIIVSGGNCGLVVNNIVDELNSGLGVGFGWLRGLNRRMFDNAVIDTELLLNNMFDDADDFYDFFNNVIDSVEYNGLLGSVLDVGGPFDSDRLIDAVRVYGLGKFIESRIVDEMKYVSDGYLPVDFVDADEYLGWLDRLIGGSDLETVVGYDGIPLYSISFTL